MAVVLVTGGAGFIGSHLTEALLKQGHRVRVLDNFSTGKRENLMFDRPSPDLEIREGDIRTLKVCQSAMETIDVVFHQAALPSVQQSIEDPLTSNSVNVEGTLNLLQAGKEKGVKRFIYASSCAVYGDDPVLPKREEMAPVPLSPYAVQKWIGEQYCRLFFQLYGLETISLRYFNIFGPRQDPNSIYSGVIPRFINALLKKSPPIIFGDGEQSRDFTYVEDVVQANLLAMTGRRVQGDAVNVACGKRTSLNQLLEILKKIFETELSPIHQEARTGDIRHSQADIRKGRGLIQYVPKVQIEAGLRKTVEYFKKK
jgi:UDP-glucose 4-epimerase